MVVAFDQGNPKDIHPIVKDTVGWRLSQLALGKVYGKKWFAKDRSSRR